MNRLSSCLPGIEIIAGPSPLVPAAQLSELQRKPLVEV